MHMMAYRRSFEMSRFAARCSLSTRERVRVRGKVTKEFFAPREERQMGYCPSMHHRGSSHSKAGQLPAVTAVVGTAGCGIALGYFDPASSGIRMA